MHPFCDKFLKFILLSFVIFYFGLTNFPNATFAQNDNTIINEQEYLSKKELKKYYKKNKKHIDKVEANYNVKYIDLLDYQIKGEYHDLYSYEEAMRQPENYISRVKLFGNVQQILDEKKNEVSLIVELETDQLVIVEYKRKENSNRILEGDYITAWGYAAGLDGIIYTDSNKKAKLPLIRSYNVEIGTWDFELDYDEAMELFEIAFQKSLNYSYMDVSYQEGDTYLKATLMNNKNNIEKDFYISLLTTNIYPNSQMNFNEKITESSNLNSYYISTVQNNHLTIEKINSKLEVKWTKKLELTNEFSLISDFKTASIGTLIFIANNKLYALNEKNGELLYKPRKVGENSDTFAVSPYGVTYILNANDSFVSAINSYGKKRWEKKRIKGFESPVYIFLNPGNREVVVRCYKNGVDETDIIIDKNSGEIIQKIPRRNDL